MEDFMSTTKSPIYVSKRGLKDLKKSISKLERTRKQYAADLRDLYHSETDDSQFQRSEKLAAMEAIDNELYEKRQLLLSAKPFPRKRDALIVAIGSAVELIDTQGRVLRYTIVDSIEANPSEGRISIASPLGRTLLGKTIQDTIEWGSGIKRYSFQLIRIR
jgi:transcription elongation factor GreA